MEFLSNCKKKLEEKGYWEILSYIFFGGATTVVNIAVFSLVHYLFGINYVLANGVAWFVSVVFAFVTNKIWVFQSKSENLQHLLWEFVKFMFYRILSLGIDMGALVLVVDIFHWPVFIGKLISQVLVVVVNYIFSKLFIFKKKSE